MMKKPIAIIISLVFVFVISAVSFAAEKTSAPATAPAAVEKKAATAPAIPAAAPAEKKEAAGTAAKKIQVTGTVAAVDAKANTVTVKGLKGDITVAINETTKIMADKYKKTLADVKTGNKVTVKYVEAEGKKVATKISILPDVSVKKDAAPALAKAEEKKPTAAK